MAASEKSLAALLFALIDNNGAVVVEYKYDAWGNHEAEVASEEYVTLANLNPFRYRGYYFDEETGLYFLQTRYYDPVVGRFISRDSIEYADPETICGLNLYAYCGNNPVMATDPTGRAEWWEWLLGIVIIVAAVALSVVTAGIATPISAALGGGMLGTIVGGAVAGAVGGAITGFGISVATQGISNGFSNINWGQVGIATLSGAIIGAVLGGIGGAVSYFKNTTALYRAVNADELTSIKSSGTFSLKAGAMESKQFGLVLQEVKNYANLPLNKGAYVAIVKIRVPNSVLSQFTKTATDTFVFKSGVITVAGNQLDLLNRVFSFIKYYKL